MRRHGNRLVVAADVQDAWPIRVWLRFAPEFEDVA